MKGKTICKTLGLVLLALLILVVLYVVDVFASYHRIGDQSLSVMLSGGRHRRHAQLAHRRDRLSERRHDGMRI